MQGQPKKRVRLNEVYGYTLRVYLRCECGEDTEIVAKITKGGQDQTGFLTPCCRRRYRLVGWRSHSGPVLKCVGYEGDAGLLLEILRIPGQTSQADADAETERLIASGEIKLTKARRDTRARAAADRRKRVI